MRAFLIPIPILALACSAPAARPAPSAAPSRPAPPKGPVLAEVRGKTGLVRVVERDGLRLLTIDDEVQAAVPAGGGPSGPDPMVRLLRAARPEAKRALVVGLGSGRTADELAAAGLEVTAVEIEPAVIELARTYFGYKGKAVVGEGKAFLEAAQERWDLVLLDAPSLAKRSTLLAALRVAGLAATRVAASPAAREIQELLDGRGGTERIFVQALAAGVGDERQNLYILTSTEPIDVAADPMTALHPLTQPGSTDGARVPHVGEVTLLGYVSRAGPGEVLVLDLPHWEMGAVRYVLGGAAAAPLEARAPKGRPYPTSGDLSSDGDLGGTLQELLAGGGFKRSEVRFSPVAAVLKGRARFRASIDPDSFVTRKGKDLKDPMLPYGGVLYDLEVTEVTWTFEAGAWKAVKARLGPALDRAEREARAGRLAAASKAFGEYVDGVWAALGPAAEQVLYAQDLRSMRGLLQLENQAKPGFATGAACDRAWDQAPARDYVVIEPVKRLRAALMACAVAHYQKRAWADKGPEAQVAAGRLLVLWDAMWLQELMSEQQMQAWTRKLTARFPGLAPLEEPPR